MRTLFVVLLLGLTLTACTEPNPGTIFPPLPTVQAWFEQDSVEDRGELGTKAIKRSSIYDTLGNDGPGMLIYISNDAALRAYIAEQGLSEEAFLNHPKLDDFVRAHLLDQAYDLDAVTIEGETRTYETAFGNSITFKRAPTSGENNRNLLANDVRFSIICAGFSDQEIRLCYAEGPLVSNFDWEE